jgi:hypothetical protein
MKNMMKQIDNRFDRVHSRFNDIERFIIKEICYSFSNLKSRIYLIFVGGTKAFGMWIRNEKDNHYQP